MLNTSTTNEAVLSSRIEDSQATLRDVLEYEATKKLDERKRDDIQEVINYRKAIYYAVEYYKKRPTCLNLIKKMHAILLDSVRGKNKARGEFRREQNFIGKPNSTIEQARYIPPPHENLMDYLSNFEKYIHIEEKDKIVQLAIIHAQFEIIHPFLDGNGRIGRILIPLFLYEKQLLSQPAFYMSEYFEIHHDEYADHLLAITKEGKWNEWIDFFLKAFIIQAKKNNKKAAMIIELYEKMKRIIHAFSSQYALPALDTIFQSTIFNSTDFTKYSDIPKSSANRLLSNMGSEGILVLLQSGKGRKPNLYLFKELFDIVK